MNKIIIRNQLELDSLPLSFDQETIIEIRSTEIIYVNKKYISAKVHACGSSVVYARGSSVVYAYNSSVVYAYNSSVVHARDLSTVCAYDLSIVYAGNSSVVYAYNSSIVHAYDSSTVIARDLTSGIFDRRIKKSEEPIQQKQKTEGYRMKLQYEDVCILINILKKLDNEEASTLLNIIFALVESDNINKLQI